MRSFGFPVKDIWLLSALVIFGFMTAPCVWGASGTGDQSSAALRQSALDNARLAQSVYDLGLKRIDGGWEQIDSQWNSDGFKAAVYQRKLPDGRRDIRVVFAGSDDMHDWANNVNQGAFLPLGTLDKIEEQQYVRAQAFAAGHAHLAKNDKSVASFELVGHSRAGGFVQVLAGILDVRATAFNSAAVVKMSDQLTSRQVENADRNVTHFVLKGDLVFPTTLSMPGARQFGTIYQIEALPDISPKPMSDLVNARLGGKILVAHSMDAINRSLETISPKISRKILVSQEGGELIVRNLAAIGTGLEEIRRFAAIKHIVKPEGVGPLPMHLRLSQKAAENLSSLGRITEVAELAAAIDADRRQFHNKPFALLDSKTVDLLSERVVSGMASKFWTVLDEHKLITHQARVSLSREALDVGGPTFGATELGKAAKDFAQGKRDIDTIETALDGLVGGVWGFLGYAMTKDLRTAERFQTYGQTLAQTGRFLFREAGLDKEGLRFWDKEFRNQADVMIDMYRFAIDGARRTGMQAPSPKEFFAGAGKNASAEFDKMLDSSGFSSIQREKLNQVFAGAGTDAPANIKTVNISGGGARPLSETLQDSRLAAELSPANGKAVVFGSGPVADRTAQRLAEKLGQDRVKVVPVALSAYERNKVAQDFEADTIVTTRLERYHELTRGGYRSKEPKPVVPRGIDHETPWVDMRDEFLPFFRRPGPPPMGGNDPDPPPPQGAAIPVIGSRSLSPRFDPSSSFPRIGGVMLQGAAEVAETDEQISKGHFSLIFQASKGAIDIPTLRRFVTSLWATYFTTNGPGISIDPVGEYTNRHAVRYIGRVINSDLGRVMRETDYMMKSWAVGTTRPDLDNWLSPEEIGLRNSKVHGGRSRFWFIPEQMKFRQAGNALLFEDGVMTIKTEYLFKRKGEQNPENEEWARQFTRRYAEVAERYPVFQELFEYAKLVSLAKYLKEKRVPLLWFLLANREMALTEDSPGTVKAFAKKSDYFEEVEIAGGVDLSPGVQAGALVVDAELLKALVEARKTASSGDTTNDTESNQIEVVEHGSEPLTVTPAQTVVISDSKSGGESFATDLGLRLNRGPHLELARYRRSHFPQVHTFGRDWHLMIPYAIEAASNRGVPSPLGPLPEKILLRNLLTGVEETLKYRDELRTGTNRTPIIGFYPEAPEFNLNIGMFPLTDRTFRLSDKLGCEYDFDSSGRLTRMLLAEHLDYRTNSAGRIMNVVRVKDYEVAYQYTQKRLNWREYDVLPFRLAPEGRDKFTVETDQFPRQLRLFDAATGSEELFDFDEKQASGLIGYFPVETNRSGYTFLGLNTDRSFVLEHKSGSKINFDRSGQFRSLVVDILERIIQEPYEVRFDYDITRGQYRIVTARVLDHKSGEPLHAVVYKYGRDGNLMGASLVSAK